MAPHATLGVDAKLLARSNKNGNDARERAKLSTLAALKVHGDKNQALKTYVSESDIPSLSEIKRHIPAHCFKPSLATSMYYVLRDILIIGTLYYGAYLTHNSPLHYVYLPIFWFFTGFFMWAVFVLGHDCGHGSFSRYKTINSIVGHILHSLILVPYHSWRISHRKHHKNTGNFEKDEIFYPMTESEYSGVSELARFIYRELFFCYPLGFLIYLTKGYGNAMSNGSHISVSSELFVKSERSMIRASVICWWSMVAFLTGCGVKFGIVNLTKYYLVPYFIYCFWLLVVTFLHHTEPGTKWYSSANWNYVKGNLESVDRVYGMLEHFHHDIGTHVVHHLFPAIPHYHLLEANEAVKPFLGALHRIEKEGPLAQLPKSISAWQQNHVIPDGTDLFVLPESEKK